MIFSAMEAKPATARERRGTSRALKTIGLVAAGALLSSSSLPVTPVESAEHRRARQEASLAASDAVDEYLGTHGIGSFSEIYSKAGRVCSALVDNPITLQIFPRDKSITCEVNAGIANISSQDSLTTLQAGHSDDSVDVLKSLPGVSCGEGCTDTSQPETATVYASEGEGGGTTRITVFQAGASPSEQQDTAARLSAMVAELTQKLTED